MDQTLEELINFVKQAAPEVWRIGYKQVVVEQIQWSIWTLVWVVIAIILARGGYLLYTKAMAMKKEDHNYSMWEMPFTFGIIGIACAPLVGLGAIASLGEVLYRFANPEWYAIQILVRLVIPAIQ